MTSDQVELLQKRWANAIIEIGKQTENIQEFAKKKLCELYDFEDDKLGYKPTHSRNIPFRKNLEATLSYFVGQNYKYPEDSGFALRGWSEIKFENHIIRHFSDFSFAMGNYYFRDGSDELYKFEYTFGYNENGKIVLHHSSLPYAAKIAPWELPQT